VFAEYLRFRVAPDQAAAFQDHNRRWREELSRMEGYIDQTTLRHAEEPETWLVIVRWRDRAAMEAFPDDVQERLDAVGDAISTLVQADHFEELPL
jgi:heme-degrading monooxygenase HmoA